MAAKKDDFSVKKISPKLGGERGARKNPNEPSPFSHDLVEEMEFLYVEVHKVVNTPKSCIPIVEITLGNHKYSTNGLPLGPNMDLNQVFAFDKTKDDVLSVTLSLKEENHFENLIVGEQNFKLAEDMPCRTPPNARIEPQWYSMNIAEETGHPVMLLMSVWFGTQADEVYSHAWFPNSSSDVSASCVINTRPRIYLAPRLCYVRVKIVSGHDLVSNDGNRTPSVYVEATLGKQVQKTEVSSGSNPSWNQELIFVASERLDDTVYIRLIDRVDDETEECIGMLKKRLSEMIAIKVPGTSPVMFYDIEQEVIGDSRPFASRIKMRIATDHSYHVIDECSQYSSDYRAFAKGLWPVMLGKLEIGILGATGLETKKELGDGRKPSTDAYVVAKYGNKWARTRTVANSFSPKWNEQYSWDVYDKCTFVTLGVYDNYCSVDDAEDVPIGKVRIPLNSLEWDKLYTRSFPIVLDLGEAGSKKTGELHLAVRCVPLVRPVDLATSRFRPTLPKAHYISPLPADKTEQLREEAIKVNCANLAKTDLPLGDEVVKDMLKPENRDLVNMRRRKANYESLYRMVQTLSMWWAWFDINIRNSTDVLPKFVALYMYGLFLVFPKWIMWFAVYGVLPGYVASKFLRETTRRLRYYNTMHGIDTPPPPLIHDDDELKLEELESFQEKVVTFIGEAASWVEKICVLFTVRDDPLASMCLWVISYMILLLVCNVSIQFLGFCFIVCLVHLPGFCNDLSSGIINFFTRLPTKEDLMFMK